MLFLEAPATVGFSTAAPKPQTFSADKVSSLDFRSFLNLWWCCLVALGVYCLVVIAKFDLNVWSRFPHQMYKYVVVCNIYLFWFKVPTPNWWMICIPFPDCQPSWKCSKGVPWKVPVLQRPRILHSRGIVWWSVCSTSRQKDDWASRRNTDSEPQGTSKQPKYLSICRGHDACFMTLMLCSNLRKHLLIFVDCWLLMEKNTCRFSS